MTLDFWNNPIVVSAFRVAQRRKQFNFTWLYLLMLAVGGALLYYYQDRLGGYWPRNYFISLIGLQFVVSGLRAVTATSASIKAEVAQRTLDFQRIAALSPSEILLGKLLGEPAQAYLLAIATIPLTVLCWLWGGVSFDGLVWMYVLMATNTLLLGTLGLLNRLEPGAGKSGRGPEAVVFTVIIGVFFSFPMLLASGMGVMGIPAVAAVLGLFTPLPAYYGVIQGDPWRYYLAFFDVPIPFLLATPVSQLLIAFVCFQTMTRQLRNPLNPAVGKGLAYAILIVIDILTASILFDPTPSGLGLETRGTVFCLIHLLASLTLVLGVTPWRETLHSWMWRFRGQRNWLRDLWLGDRSENGAALLTFAIIGIASLALLVVLPWSWETGNGVSLEAALALTRVALTSVLLMLTVGTFYQWAMFVAGRGGVGLTMLVVILIVAVPHIVGYYYQLEDVMALTPSYHFGRWLFDPPRPTNPVYMLAGYGLALVLLRYSFQRYVGYLGKRIDKTLEKMFAEALEGAQ